MAERLAEAAAEAEAEVDNFKLVPVEAVLKGTGKFGAARIIARRSAWGEAYKGFVPGVGLMSCTKLSMDALDHLPTDPTDYRAEMRKLAKVGGWVAGSGVSSVAGGLGAMMGAMVGGWTRGGCCTAQISPHFPLLAVCQWPLTSSPPPPPLSLHHPSTIPPPPKVAHPNIANVLGCAMPDDGAARCMICELATGTSLRDRLARAGGKAALDWKLRVSIVVSVANVLDHLHTQMGGMVHGELTGASVLVNDRDQSVKVIDYGIRRSGARPSRSDLYLEPNYVQTGNYTPRSDVYRWEWDGATHGRTPSQEKMHPRAPPPPHAHSHAHASPPSHRPHVDLAFP